MLLRRILSDMTNDIDDVTGNEISGSCSNSAELISDEVAVGGGGRSNEAKQLPPPNQDMGPSCKLLSALSQ